MAKNFLLGLLGRRETETGRILENQYPHSTSDGLGLYELIEILGTDATRDALDDHHRLLAGALLLGLNLGYKKNAQGLDLGLAFREKDL